jgi:hypothetical protein
MEAHQEKEVSSDRKNSSRDNQNGNQQTFLDAKKNLIE